MRTQFMDLAHYETKYMSLSHDEIRRYSRHLLLPQVGQAGQEKLKAASVLLVGAGGLGSPLALYLAAAGVGRIGIVDFDVVDASNLQRQVLHGTATVGTPKIESAVARLRDLNPHVIVEPHPVRLTSANALDLLRQYDIVADGSDNFPTRYLVNDAAVLTGIPNVYGAIYRFEGQVSVFGMPGGPCYRCLHPTPPAPGSVPSCAEAGVLGVLPGLVGTLQATEVLKLILGIGEPLVGKLLMVDTLYTSYRTLRIKPSATCPVCGPNRTLHHLIDYEAFCGLTNASDHADDAVPEMTVHAFQAARLANSAPFLLDVRKPHEDAIATLNADLLIPVGELQQRLDELEAHRTQTMVVHCRSGKRSAKAVALLREAGFDAINLKGGTLAWSAEVDASVPTY